MSTEIKKGRTAMVSVTPIGTRLSSLLLASYFSSTIFLALPLVGCGSSAKTSEAAHLDAAKDKGATIQRHREAGVDHTVGHMKVDAVKSGQPHFIDGSNGDVAKPDKEHLSDRGKNDPARS